MAADIFRPLLNALRLPGCAVEPRQEWAFVIGVDDIRVARIHRDVTAFAASHRIPIALKNRAVVAPRANADGSVVLLLAIDAVEKIVVGHDMVKLGRRLI